MTQLGIFFALAMDMAISLVGGFVIGYWVDTYFNTFPWLTIIFFFAGIAAGVNIAILIIKKFKKTFPAE